MTLRRFLLHFSLRALHAARAATQPMTLGVRAIVADKSGAVLLVRHSYLPGWHLPGGGVAPGETCAAAIRREVLEEANVNLLAEPRLLGLYFNSRHSRRDHVALFLARDFELAGPRKPDWEIREAGFFPVENLPETTTRATRERLREWLEDAAPSQVW